MIIPSSRSSWSFYRYLERVMLMAWIASNFTSMKKNCVLLMVVGILTWYILSYFLRGSYSRSQTSIHPQSDNRLPRIGLVASKVCYSVVFDGRLGNLMFEYATLVGLCAWRKQKTEICGIVSMPAMESVLLPLHRFVKGFNIPHSQIGCPLNVSSRFFNEHEEDRVAYYFNRNLFHILPGSVSFHPSPQCHRNCTTLFN